MLSGSYAGFDENEPTSQQDGKAQVIAYLKHRYGYRKVVMVGDGATDLEACPPAVSCAICFQRHRLILLITLPTYHYCSSLAII